MITLVKNAYCAKNSYSEKSQLDITRIYRKKYTFNVQCNKMHQFFNFNSYTYYVEKN